jgi:hypothetical protein
MTKPLSILQAWEQSVLDNYLAQMDAKNITASGKSRSESKVVMREDGCAIQVPGYHYWLLNGRKPNQDQSTEGLNHFMRWAGYYIFTPWAKAKSISINPYAVAWSVAKYGFKAKDITVVTKQQESDLLNQLGNFYLGEIKNNLQQSWQR